MDNPTCGDVIHLQAQVVDDRVQAVAFTGQGCSISQASASLMTEAVTGKSVAEALNLAKLFSAMATGEARDAADLAPLGDAAVLANVMDFPARIKCATLAWWALQRALLQDEEENTDE